MGKSIRIYLADGSVSVPVPVPVQGFGCIAGTRAALDSVSDSREVSAETFRPERHFMQCLGC
jgi:hypothetical protein